MVTNNANKCTHTYTHTHTHPHPQTALASILDEDDGTMSGLGAGTGAAELDKAWHAAEAWHFYLLTQQHIYSGNADLAMKSAVRLMDYEDVLGDQKVYSLVALTAVRNKCYGVASNAFIKLEALADTDKANEYEKVGDFALVLHPRTHVRTSTHIDVYITCILTCLL